MLVSTRGRYALRILVDLAEHRTDAYVTLRELADRQDISEKYLESIVKELVRAGILEGLRGKGGGYRLGREPERISVLEVLERMEGTLAPVACLEPEGKPCARASSCRTLPLWMGLDETVRAYLGRFSIQSLMRTEDGGFDYVI